MSVCDEHFRLPANSETTRIAYIWWIKWHKHWHSWYMKVYLNCIQTEERLREEKQNVSSKFNISHFKIFRLLSELCNLRMLSWCFSWSYTTKSHWDFMFHLSKRPVLAWLSEECDAVSESHLSMPFSNRTECLYRWLHTYTFVNIWDGEDSKELNYLWDFDSIEEFNS